MGYGHYHNITLPVHRLSVKKSLLVSGVGRSWWGVKGLDCLLPRATNRIDLDNLD